MYIGLYKTPNKALSCLVLSTCITRDMFFPGKGTHITSGMFFFACHIL